MKKVLVTGAAGSIGLNVIKYLLAEGKYEITALDLKNKRVFKRLKRYRKRVNIIFGDVLDRTLIEALVKDHDYIIHLASCLPPLAEIKKDLANIIDYTGTENIVRAINYYNPKCHLIYASTTSLYQAGLAKSDSKISVEVFDYFNYAKYNAEKLIMKKAKFYTILRIPLVLSDLRNEPFMYNGKKDDIVEVVTKEDAAYAFCKAVLVSSKVNKQILNIGGGSSCTCLYQELLNNILKYHGLSWSYINNRLFIPKNYYSPRLLDSDDANKLLNYRSDSLESYFMRQKRRSSKRKIAKIFGKLFIKKTKKDF